MRPIQHDILRALTACIAPGDRVLVLHSSLPHLVPPTQLTADDFLIPLRSLVSDGLTLVFPSFTFAFCTTGRFHFRHSLPETGLLAQWIASAKDAVRTPHPIYSFVVLGPLAADLAAVSNTTTFGDDSAFAWCEAVDARLTMMGSDWSSCSQLHRYEEEARVPYRSFKRFDGTASFSDAALDPISTTMFVRDLDIDPEITGQPVIEMLRSSGQTLRAPLWKGHVESASCRAFGSACRMMLQRDPWALVEHASAKKALHDAKSRSARPPVLSAGSPGTVEHAAPRPPSVGEPTEATDPELPIRRYLIDEGLVASDGGEQSLFLDSYATIQLIVFMEREFHISVMPEDIRPEVFASARSMALFVTAKRASGRGRASTAPTTPTS